jgi:hypothetical protein
LWRALSANQAYKPEIPSFQHTSVHREMPSVAHSGVS